MKHTFCLFLFTQLLFAQFRPVDPRQTYERVIAIVPMVGSGQPHDPKRPLFSDTPDLIGYQAELSDNGQFALVEFVARSRTAFARISPVTDARVQVFRKTDGRREDIIREFQKLKAKFNLENFGLSVK
jgi:hypothetical protein